MAISATCTIMSVNGVMIDLCPCVLSLRIIHLALSFVVLNAGAGIVNYLSLQLSVVASVARAPHFRHFFPFDKKSVI